MAATLIIADFFAKGRPLKEEMVSASVGDNRHDRKDISVSLNLNQNTNKLLEMAINGTNIETVKLEYTTKEKKITKTYLVYELNNSIISSYQIFGSHDAPDKPTIWLNFNYQKMSWKYDA